MAGNNFPAIFMLRQGRLRPVKYAAKYNFLEVVVAV